MYLLIAHEVDNEWGPESTECCTNSVLKGTVNITARLGAGWQAGLPTYTIATECQHASPSLTIPFLFFCFLFFKYYIFAHLQLTNIFPFFRSPHSTYILLAVHLPRITDRSPHKNLMIVNWFVCPLSARSGLRRTRLAQLQPGLTVGTTIS